MTKQEHRNALREFDVEHLLKLLALEAKKVADGHYTILSFTTHYKAAFGTPDLYGGAGREQVGALPGYPTLKDAIIFALVESRDFYGERR